MMTDEIKLVKYDAACNAITAAKSVDEVLTIRDASVRMKLYARQAGNREMEADAIEIRMRATRRMDQMRQEQKATVGLAKGAIEKGTNRGTTRGNESPASLTEAGINKDLAKEGRKLGALSDDEFEQSVGTAREAIGKVVKGVFNTSTKQETRATREQELGQRQVAMPDKRYGVILADPPWSFEPYSRDTGMDRAADNHYPTMGTDAIAEMSKILPSAPDCVLFLWATNPMLPEALRIMESWSFKYKSNFVWVKDKVGTGYWNRSRHELLLVGTKGSIPAPAPGTQYDSVIESLRGEHSAKPFSVHEMIEDLFPTLPRIELFARQKYEGWDAWGNEVRAAE